MSTGIYIHPTSTYGEEFTPSPFAVIDEFVKIGDNVKIGSFVHIHTSVVIGNDVVIGDNVTIHPATVIEDGCSIADFAVVGRGPKVGKSSTAQVTDLGPLRIGAGTSVGSHTVLMAGTTIGRDSVVGDNAGIREKCSIGDNTIVGRSVTVENGTTIGSRVRIQSGAYVTAYVTIEDDVFIAPMVVTTNDNYMGRTDKVMSEMKGCTVRRGARVGGGTHILPGIEIGEDGFVATGAVVSRDVPARTVVMGVPAKAVREVAEDELLSNQ